MERKLLKKSLRKPRGAGLSLEEDPSIFRPPSKSPVMPLSPTDAVISPCSRAILERKGSGSKNANGFRKAALQNALNQQCQQQAKMRCSRLQHEEEIRLRSSTSSRDVSVSPPNVADLKETLFALPIRPKPQEARGKRLILGSSSSKVAQVLVEAGWVFEVVSPENDERISVHGGNKEDLDIYDLSITHAKKSLEGVLPKMLGLSSALVITTSQVVVTGEGFIMGDRMFGLPTSQQQAREMLSTYSGKKLKVISSIVVTNTETKKQVEGIDVATVIFDEITDDMMDRIVAREETLTCPGAFNINDLDLREAINHINGDVDSVFGLPLDVLCDLVKQCVNSSSSDDELSVGIKSK
mmetsp:Transcript_27518/g.36072  ORF Transcript_27518/g.36072 Transcript_27518/m.36072 type:complete len:354 (+) Transcript_27518:258-1319(+)|eukprot:CAMPEP_0117743136 /NCGR_PEP_ID=MMETSP0947-20121206/5952_1 /TAXON_ID=44440 /ORGANISM="Chattonella subsalsa, Strain CCMP2191" /LENGTH=353 /DNA_ID=CAMNT_0005559773 /DNA_START=183 /DNA_END=1244 /DNA_ORIENTATION=-